MGIFVCGNLLNVAVGILVVAQIVGNIDRTPIDGLGNGIGIEGKGSCELLQFL